MRKQEIPKQNSEQKRNSDLDSLHILPLSIIPVSTPALAQTRMIKNMHLESVVEFFSDSKTGSGQFETNDLIAEFDWSLEPPHPDLILLRKLALLPSYDVYSLRILLRENGIAVNSVDALKLSDAKTNELSDYMKAFTRPLIMEIYGGDVAIQDFDDILLLFRDPEVKKAREKLRSMAEKLEVRIDEIPSFFEDYGDVFLSLAYYRQCLDQIVPLVGTFFDSMIEIRGNLQLNSDANLMHTINMMQTTINELMVSVTGRFENFDRSSENLWDNITAERFHKIEELIKSYHTTIGGVLCALSIKMEAWATRFPDKDTGGPVKRSEFIMNGMQQGMNTIQRLEDSAPMLSELEKEATPATKSTGTAT